MGLINKLLKIKRMQRLAGSLAMIVPELWIRNMGWSQRTNFAMEIHPFNKQIVITEIPGLTHTPDKDKKSETDIEDGEKASNPVLV